MVDLLQNKPTWSRIVTIQDLSFIEPLFGAQPVYCLCDEDTLSGDVFITHKPNVNPPVPNFSNTGSINDTVNNLVVHNSYAGINNPGFEMKGRWSMDLGSYTDTGSAILTPYKILVMALSGKTFYVKDENIIEQIKLESNNNLFANGIPVNIKSYSLKASSRKKGLVEWSIVFDMDREA